MFFNDQYLVVWDADEVNWKTDIYRQFLNASIGVFVGREVRISSMSSSGVTP